MSHTKINTFDVYTINSPDGSTQASFVPEKGGVGSSIILPFAAKKREILFQHMHFWERNNPHLPGGWPFLFPVCARLERNNIAGNYLYNGKTYNLPIHGFAPYLPWQVTAHSPATLTLALAATPQTLTCFPFHFRIELKYEVKPGMLTCEQKYINSGDQPFPYYAGFHPYFSTPPVNQGKEQVTINFTAQRHFKYNDKLTDVIGEQPLLKLPAAITSPEVNEQLSLLGKDKIITLSDPRGTIYLEAQGSEDPDLFKYLQIYTQPTEPFICLEPWMSFPNALNTVAGARWLKPQTAEHGKLKLWL